MAKLLPQVHVCLGNPKVNLAELESAAENRDSDGWWTINRAAIPGDRMVFYMIRPMSAFVGTGVVASKPFVVDDPDSGWYGHYAVKMKDVEMLSRRVTLQEARQRFPDWGYLRQPRRSTPIPSDVVGEFLAFLQAGKMHSIHFAEESDIEGTKTEVLRIISKRSRKLRDLAFERAKGVCCVCGRDFLKVLGGCGVRVLQVHHRDQLSARDAPAVTKVSDLAVVCANCHLLLHLDPDKAMTVEELQKMLRVDGDVPCG